MPDTPQNPTNLRIAEPGIRALFTMESRWQAWLDVEAALARAEADLGMIPAAAAAEIAAKAKVELLDREYPHDRARGYAAGDIRGAFSVVWPAARD